MRDALFQLRVLLWHQQQQQINAMRAREIAYFILYMRVHGYKLGGFERAGCAGIEECGCLVVCITALRPSHDDVSPGRGNPQPCVYPFNEKHPSIYTHTHTQERTFDTNPAGRDMAERAPKIPHRMTRPAANDICVRISLIYLIHTKRNV